MSAAALSKPRMEEWVSGLLLIQVVLDTNIVGVASTEDFTASVFRHIPVLLPRFFNQIWIYLPMAMALIHLRNTILQAASVINLEIVGRLLASWFLKGFPDGMKTTT